MNIKDYKNIIWDFDGVILDSLKIKDAGFYSIAHRISPEVANEFLLYHQDNGGLTRFQKFRYLYETLLNQSITDKEIDILAGEFSVMMTRDLTNPQFLIDESLTYLKQNYQKQNFHVASGTEEKELQFLCKELGIAHYFKSIKGSPTHKNILVEKIIADHSFQKNETCLIGDSRADWEAAQFNGIEFWGYNNPRLKDISDNYIINF